MLFTFTSCASGSKTNAQVEGELSDIFVKIYENADIEAPVVVDTVVDDTNKASMLGSADVTFIEGLVSEAAIMTIPHSMVLIRVDENTDIRKN